MPVQTGKSSFDFSKSLTKHATDTTDYGQEFIDLPGGIQGGRARLVEAKLGVYKTGANQGKEFLYLAGVVVSPKTATDIKKVWDNGKVRVVSAKEVTVEGQRTSIMVPLCETKNGKGEITSADDNVAKALNELRKVGGEECTAGVDSKPTLIELLDQLKEAGPLFKFSTQSGDPTAQYPNARTFENWHGTKGLEDVPPDEGEGDRVTDDTGTVLDEEVSLEQQVIGDIPDVSSMTDLDDLVGMAADDVDAQNRLIAIADELGVKDEAEAAADWEAVKVVIEEAQAAAAEPEPEEEKPWEPAKGDNVKYHAVDPKTKKPAVNPKTKKPVLVECEITAIDRKTKTVTLKNLTDGKTLYSKVKFDALEPV